MLPEQTNRTRNEPSSTPSEDASPRAARAALRLMGGSSDMEGSYALIFSMGALDLLPSSSSVYPYP